MKKIAFICHGNICRSVMAEYILKDKLLKEGRNDVFVDSFAVSFEEIGNPIYPPARSCLVRHNIPILNHRAKHFDSIDYDKFDEIYYMDSSNLRRLEGIHYDTKNKYKSLLDRPVADPWYSGNFEECFQDLVLGISKIKY